MTGNAAGRHIRHHVVTIKGGELHLRGSLTEGTCVISAERRDMQIDMGRYRTDDFTGVGSLSAVRIPFDIHLTACNQPLAGNISVSFYGATAPRSPDLFLVTSDDGNAAGLSDSTHDSGLGLQLSDSAGDPIIPNHTAGMSLLPLAGNTIMHFTARYQATARHPRPGELRSEVWFRLVYP
ncbi:hypothetical protein BL250_15965 [Erwinia sp. OLTSP20]|nr:hypothetical protein BV501_10975 [Erwinia sp. OAMSP11]PIJ70961.1 hypothetical protein BK416_12165 [Erwinia sp. OLSSP12]PIJ80327.1 hypothetical protein BLD47_11030 [Erwinia sp. OLCASP19]PIJ82451.1 hypothetical protein BLD46_10780 [Erwinia sp. OLMTSP26]PIJ85136.1 hypothetical protein BLD49_10890 [Erwinia sp. OLMDSP33]PIJ89258.1 hypothetical protein BL250_15965 [Erwinia sp. OLTSP20]PIJ95215.1 hypothetical protein BL249_00025 [Erwinia sp. OLFS4]